MSKEQSNSSADTSENLASGSYSKIKVSSYTQVEPEYVGNEIRRIVGQEDGPEQYLANQLQDLNFRKQNKGVRPPLVGQASSSSNDSVSFEERPNDDGNYEQNTHPLQIGVVETFPDHDCVGHVGINFNRGSYTHTPFLLNREEYINQRPPEGSSDQVSVMIQPLDNIQDFPRIRSPSSASSVTSSKPLEWDSGADVGYNQVYSANAQSLDPSMSTIERMALVCGTNLLTRSDPEGTTGPNGKPSNIYKISGQINPKPKYRLGFPNAESTPFSTGVLINGSSEALSEDVNSPINCENIYVLHTLSNSDINEELQANNSNEILSEKCPLTFKPLEAKIPLFPELINAVSNPSNKQISKLDQGTSSHNYSQLQVTGVEQNIKSKIGLVNEQPEFWNERNSFATELNNKLNSFVLESELKLDINTKKISSSLDNVSIIDSEPSNNKCNSNTLPRSQSQINVHVNELPTQNTDDKNSYPKYSMALHSLVQYNKSASSSSIATVVQKKGDSPKHKFAQTSVHKKESIGIQVCDGKDVGKSKIDVCTSTQFTETPHLPKSDLFQNCKKRSNYFNFEIRTDGQNSDILVHDNMKLKLGEEVKMKTNDKIMTCTGAHKKVLHTERVKTKEVWEDYKHTRSNICANEICSNIPSTHRGDVTLGTLTRVNNNNKLVSGTNTVESVESSAKSGGCWTDKNYSVTVEDRVNSFEYLPGHVYENTGRQAPLDSHGTSSISIHNQTSNNETPDEHTRRSWDSTASTSSNLEKDVQKGVDMISEFVKGSCAQDSALKKKLIRRVVEKLITKNYNDDKVEHIDLKSNVPWVPSQPPNVIERNGRETRRSVLRSKVPCEFSSRSEKSGSTNASSDCFIPKPAASSTFLPSNLRENTSAGLPGQVSNSSTSEISVEKKNHGKPLHPVDIKAQVINYGSLSKDLTDSSNKPPRSSNWREPATKMEKLLEERKKICSESSNSQSDAMTLVQYLNMERENQLFWIRSEIQHLSNLKQLLEKQEQLKQGMKVLKFNKQRLAGSDILKDRNRDRVHKENGRSSTTEKSEVCKKTSSPKIGKKYQPTLGAWLERTAADSKASTTLSSAVSAEGMEDWTSHHYKNNNDENLRSCMKRKPKMETFRGDKKVLPEKERDKVIYDEPPLNSYRRKTNELRQSKALSTPFRQRANSRVGESVFITEGVTKRNAQTETQESVGVQTSKSVEQLPVVHPNWFKRKCGPKREERGKGSQSGCQCMCQCEGKNSASGKAPVGYFITFQSSPRNRGAPFVEPLEEVRIPVPMSEPKEKVSRRLRAGLNCREKDRAIEESESGSEKEVVGGSETNTASSHNGDCGRLYREKPFQGATGILQYYLLRNRPSYISRAEDRRQCIAQMQYLRELRNQSKRRLLSLTEPAEAPPAAPLLLGVRRVFSQHSMRRQTERKYKQLAEVQHRQQDTKRKEGYRTNRLMAEIFNKKLQKRVLKGEVNLSNSVSVISSI